MREFTLDGFVAHLAGLAVELEEKQHHALEKAARIVEKEAKAEIGHYQDQAGPFAAWRELADSTKADRVHKGFTENDPLLRTGDLRESIGHEVDGNVAIVGSTSDVAVYQELGTSKIPPRSFLAGALVRKSEQVVNALGREYLAPIIGPSDDSGE
jgi:HK97 gp10 family phage protein